MNRIEQVFGETPVLLPVVHPASRETALESVRVVSKHGIKGVFVIDQGLDEPAVLALITELRATYPALWIGVNLLTRRPPAALAAALAGCGGRIDGIWADTAGIDERATTQPVADEFRAARGAWDGLLFGGVAFKYQRAVAAADLAAAARIGAGYVDVICTSGPGTGQAADVAKLRTMKQGAGDHAIALASGITADNVRDYLPYVDAFMVGTGLESSFGVIDEAKLVALLAAMRAG